MERPSPAVRRRVRDVYLRLRRRYGPQRWWPARTPFEVMVGAILTQNTAWKNVEKSIANLRVARALTPAALDSIPLHRLKRLTRPSGFYNLKAPRIKALARYVRTSGGIAKLRRRPTAGLRNELLDLDGVGPETADSILLYALGRPSFVVDAYTRRLFERLGVDAGTGYDAVKDSFEGCLPRDVATYSEYHALVVEHSKVHCRAKPLCGGCPLAAGCAYFARHRNRIDGGSST